MKTQKNKSMPPLVQLYYLFSIICCGILPLLFIQLQYNTWNPFQLNGKKFLAFYCLLLLLCHGAKALERTCIRQTDRCCYWSRVLPIAVLLTGVIRLVQGIGNAKPVGFLLLLLVLHLVLIASARKGIQKLH